MLLQGIILHQENVDLYRKANLVRQENIDLYKQVKMHNILTEANFDAIHLYHGIPVMVHVSTYDKFVWVNYLSSLFYSSYMKSEEAGPTQLYQMHMEQQLMTQVYPSISNWTPHNKEVAMPEI